MLYEYGYILEYLWTINALLSLHQYFMAGQMNTSPHILLTLHKYTVFINFVVCFVYSITSFIARTEWIIIDIEKLKL